MSIKANELRIGNWVAAASLPGYPFDFQVHSDDIVKAESESHEYYPIPITEDWLLKFGFERVDEYFFIPEIYILIDGENYCVHRTWGRSKGLWNEDNDYIKFVCYVHQLQNLFFALTGQELTVKELA